MNVLHNATDIQHKNCTSNDSAFLNAEIFLHSIKDHFILSCVVSKFTWFCTIERKTWSLICYSRNIYPSWFCCISICINVCHIFVIWASQIIQNWCVYLTNVLPIFFIEFYISMISKIKFFNFKVCFF